MNMKVKDFIVQAQALLHTTDDYFWFENPGDMSSFLYGFRSLQRHPGDYKDGVWTMVRAEGKYPIEMKVSSESTIVSRRSLFEIANMVVDEANDMLLCEYGPNAKLYEHVCVEGFKPQLALLGKAKMWAAIGVPVVATVLALFGFNNGSALRQIITSAVGITTFIAIVTMRPKVSSKAVPWMVGCFDLAVIALGLCRIYGMGVACWLLVGSIPLWATWLQSRFKLPPIILVASLGIVVTVLCNCLLLSDATRCSQLLAFARGEEVEDRAGLAAEQSRWKQTMCAAPWFGSTEGQVVQVKRTTHSVAQLVDVTQRLGKRFPLTLCVLLLALFAALVVPLFRRQYDKPVRLFGILSAMWLVTPVLLTVSAAYMLVPPLNIQIPFFTWGGETIYACVLLGLRWRLRS